MAVKPQPISEEFWAVVTESGGCSWVSQGLLTARCRSSSCWWLDILGSLLEGRFAAMASQVSESMLAYVRNVFNLYLKHHFGPPCSLLPLVSSPNRMIHGSQVECILNTWPAQQRWCWKMVASGRCLREDLIVGDAKDSLELWLMWKILWSIVCWNCNRCLISQWYKCNGVSKLVCWCKLSCYYMYL